MKDVYENPLCSRYASEQMQHLFSPQWKFSTFRRLWLALAESEQELGLSITDEQLDQVTRATGLYHLIHTLPEGYDTLLSDKLNLSAGQKQLMTIARAMIENAPMLILDEATSSVDTRTEMLIQQAMDTLTKGRTSFVIAHRLSTIRQADVILVIDHGKIVEQGTRASEIVNRVRAYAKHQNPKLTMEDMSVSVDRAIETFVRSRRTTAPVVRQIIPYLWADIDGWEIELAVLNILKNAADAIEGVEDGEIHVEVKPEDRYWRIEVTDNGPKVTQEDVDRFMMPLVTTKENGLGLGISIVANIAERHHGRLIGIANPERGVTICLDIPRAVMPEHTAI